MSEFSERCKQLLSESGSNVYQIAKRSSLDRTSIQRMITGKRLPSLQFVKDFCSYLRISPIEKSELLELYEMEKLGKPVYFNRWYIKNLIETLSLTEDNQTFIETNMSGYSHLYEYNLNSLVNFSDSAVLPYTESTILTILKLELQNNKKPEILLNVPASYLFLFQSLQRIFIDSSPETHISHLITLNKNPGSSSHPSKNLETLGLILPTARVLSGKYYPYYIYSSLTPSDEKLLIMPYYIVTSRHLLIISSDFKTVSIHTASSIVEKYRSEFQRILSMAEPLIKYTTQSFEIISLLKRAYGTLGKPSHTLEYHPCYFYMNSSFQLPESLIKSLSISSDFITAFREMYAALEPSSITSKNFFSHEGLEMFCSSGKCLGQYSNMQEGYSPTERKLMLSQYYHRNQQNEFHGHMLKSSFKTPIYLNIELHNEHCLHLFSLREDFKFSFIEIEESSICDSFYDFFEALPESELVYNKEETCKILSEYIDNIK